MRFEAIAFDMDGVLFDTEALDLKIWGEVGKTLGIPLGPEAGIRTVGLNRARSLETFAEMYGPEYDYSRVWELRLEYTHDYMVQNGVPMKKGVRELLDFLDENRVPYTLATSTDRDRAYWLLERTGLSERFKYRVCGDMVRFGKPDPDIYLRAAEVLGKEPGRVLALEDSPYGVEAACRAGMSVVMVPDLIQPDENTRARAFCVADSLLDIIPLMTEA